MLKYFCWSSSLNVHWTDDELNDVLLGVRSEEKEKGLRWFKEECEGIVKAGHEAGFSCRTCVEFIQAKVYNETTAEGDQRRQKAAAKTKDNCTLEQRMSSRSLHRQFFFVPPKNRTDEPQVKRERLNPANYCVFLFLLFFFLSNNHRASEWAGYLPASAEATVTEWSFFNKCSQIGRRTPELLRRPKCNRNH